MSKVDQYLTKEQIKELQTGFIQWYRQERRNLPWRQTNDPYGIWISEIMLQQTRVDTVIGYYYRFMEKYPTIEALAAADEQELLKVWEGLGYYSRARNLKASVEQIVADFNGKMPETIEAIRSLKGIGPYTAGAIASIAFQLPEPAIDGNVMRVVSRLFGIEEDIAKASSRKVFDEAMREIIDPLHPGDFNQALMDLGSGICTPTSPECEVCPLKSFCQAYQEERQLDFPVKTKKAKPKNVYYLAMAIEDSTGGLLLQQRPDSGLLAKMWTFPLVEVDEAHYHRLKETWQKSEPQQDLFAVAETEELPAELSSDVVWQKRHLGEITHIFSHLKWHVLLFYGRSGRKTLAENQRWAQEKDFPKIVFPKAQLKLLSLLNEAKHND